MPLLRSQESLSRVSKRGSVSRVIGIFLGIVAGWLIGLALCHLVIFPRMDWFLWRR